LAIRRQCQELLRYFKHPRRLCENLVAKRIWSVAGLSPGNDVDADLAECLEASVRLSLKYASPRQRAIIERCDLAGEKTIGVASDLGVSLRHLYRERAEAIALVASHLGEEGSREKPVVQVVPDTLALQLSLAARLEQNGRWTVGAEMLESLCSEVHEASKRCLVESRLTDLYTNVGRYSLADEHVRRALEICDGADVPAWVNAEASISAARLAFASGAVTAAQDIARRCCVELRSWSPSIHDPRVMHALLGALNLSSEIAINRGDSVAAAAFTSEASAVARQLQSPDIAALIETRFHATMAQILNGNPRSAEADFWTCYELAIEGGLTLDAVEIASLLASYWRLTDKSSQSIELLNPLHDIALDVAVGDVRAGFFIELGSAAADVQDASLARRCLVELHKFSDVSPWIHANIALLASRVELANRHFEISLKAAEVAESSFIRIGRERFLGPSLQIQAESLAALGESARALRTMRLAIAKLEGTGHHYRRLVVAYLAMASLTGDHRFAAKARNARAMLGANP
jgi:tetratricopeptide (TPR) repeat protein